MEKKSEIPEIRKSWNEFKEEIINENTGKFGVFYRGHGNSNWKLETTLSRYVRSKTEWRAQDYHEKILLIARNVPKLDDLFNRVPEVFPFIKDFWYPPQLHEKDNYEQQANDIFSLMIHLRHYGIPSPLLDWTKDPYTASFFAFSDINQSCDAAVFALKNTKKPEVIQAFDPSKPRLYLVGESDYINEQLKQSLRNDLLLLNRHYAQDAAYTICYANGDLAKINYIMMDQIEYILQNINCQEVGANYELEKYVIPAGEKKIALKDIMYSKNKSYKSLLCTDISYEDLSLKHFFF